MVAHGSHRREGISRAECLDTGNAVIAPPDHGDGLLCGSTIIANCGRSVKRQPAVRSTYTVAKSTSISSDISASE